VRDLDGVRRLDVGRLRARSDVVVVERTVTAAMLVLGSTQSASLVRQPAMLDVVRRRGGGGAVLVDPVETIWIDLWLPRVVLRQDDVRSLLGDAGEHMRTALESLGVGGLHLWRPETGAGRSVACFAGLGHGELVDDRARKVVGVTAWRSRDGALVQLALYRRRDTALPGLLEVSASERVEIDRALEINVTDLAAIAPEVAVEATFGHALAAELARATGGALEAFPPEIEADLV
jgi:lipoate-protein ligase A